jgi:GTPase Era involved in 16S rRNA processing
MKKTKQPKKTLNQLLVKKLGTVTTDADRALALKKAIKKLRAVEDLVCDALADTPQRVDMLFEINRVAVDIEEQFNYYAYGEVDNIR